MPFEKFWTHRVNQANKSGLPFDSIETANKEGMRLTLVGPDQINWKLSQPAVGDFVLAPAGPLLGKMSVEKISVSE